MADEGQVIKRVDPQLSIWAIGQGFEGTASDWTEYVVWLIGFLSLMWFVYQRNLPVIDLDEVRHFECDEGDGEDETAEDEQAAESDVKRGDGKKQALRKRKK
eukprot:gnl/TRDRNA2_/TRDRNA2_193663_c0_seq1.p2 gnl/TRDRNA2_/TRDRNA2_193663_c0~~gnl/TRDRNA2_/TRDRNA2_193663_c0_seq1.p2  ORF type:complete len:116 (-),score=31.33 gnl/TRDRNA2_/TRDRNA2_193663_c0_seq1:18-323(-)